jgi:hypothetical protein
MFIVACSRYLSYRISLGARQLRMDKKRVSIYIGVVSTKGRTKSCCLQEIDPYIKPESDKFYTGLHLCVESFKKRHEHRRRSTWEEKGN